jgi:IclR family acetate operon transcriptional repressor
MSQEIPVKATKTTFAIVERLIALDGAGVSKLADELDRPKTTIHDHLTTLDQLGYIRREGEEYKAGTKFLRIGEKARENIEIYQTAKPELEKLAREVGKHASLMIEENGMGVYLLNAEIPDTVNIVAPEGTPTKLHTTAPGKAILAHLPEPKTHDIIEENGLTAETTNTITDEETLLEELEQIRNQEYAVDQEEGLKGMQGVAAPVFRRNANVPAGAISIYGPTRSTDIDDFEEELLEELRRTVNIVEINFNY